MNSLNLPSHSTANLSFGEGIAEPKNEIQEKLTTNNVKTIKNKKKIKNIAIVIGHYFHYECLGFLIEYSIYYLKKIFIQTNSFSQNSFFASTSFSQNSFSPTLCSGENVKIRSDESIKCKKIKNIIIFTSSTKYEKQETNTKVSLKKRFWSMTVENTLIKSLRDSTERSVEEDQFAVACEGKSKESLNFFKDTYFKLENAIKPLKGISNYKIQELENILKIVNFLELKDLSKRSVEEDPFCGEQSKGVRNKMKKQDIYNKIINIITTV